MKTQSTENNERFWLWELLWTDEQNIKDAVANYNKTPWYKTARFVLCCLVIGTLLLTAILTKQWIDYLIAGIVMLPVCYFVIRGYRFSYVLLAAYKLYDVILKLQTIQTVKPSPMGIFWLVFWTAIWLGLCITCFRIESARHKMFKDAGKITTTDKLMLIVCGLVMALFIAVTAIELSDPMYQLEQKYGAKNVEIAEDSYIHTVTIPDMCKDVLPKMAEIYNEVHSEKVTAEDLKNIYLYRYWSLNKDILIKLPESLIKEFGEVAGEETTRTMTAEFIEIGQSVMGTEKIDDSVYMTICSMLFTVDDKHMKIDIR